MTSHQWDKYERDEDDVNYTGSGSEYLARRYDEWDHDTAPQHDDLVSFAEDCPTAGWTYQGFGTGGHVLAWSGYVCWGEEEAALSTVRFHVHSSGPGNWDFGSMWVEDWPDYSISINGQVNNRDNLTRVIEDHRSSMGI